MRATRLVIVAIYLAGIGLAVLSAEALLYAALPRDTVSLTLTQVGDEVTSTVSVPVARSVVGAALRCSDIDDPDKCASTVNGECAKSGHGTAKPGSSKWDAISKTCTGTCADGAIAKFECSAKPKAIIDEPDPTSVLPHDSDIKPVCRKGTAGCEE